MAPTIFPEKEPPKPAQALATQIERDGGHALAMYQDPVGGHWQIFALLPREKVEASPYQRDLSPTHVKRLTEAVKKLDRFIDPVVVVEPEVGFQILPLNTEKAHNLKEKSLEVIRMYRALAGDEPSSTEEAPILRRVDKFLKTTLGKGLEDREERAALVRAADEALGVVVAKIKKRGINHPYVKNYVLARTTPLTRARKTLPAFEPAFRKLRDNIEAFDVSRVRYEDVQRSAIMAIPAAAE